MSIFGSIMSAIFKSGSQEAAAPQSAPPMAPATPPADAGTRSPAAPSGGSTATATLERRDARSTATAEVKTAESRTGTSAAAQSSSAAERVDVAAVLMNLAAQNEERLDWRRSIVDLMKLLHLDSSLNARKELARELHYTGDMNDSAAMNIWLHRQVMLKLAENGGMVPADLIAR